MSEPDPKLTQDCPNVRIYRGLTLDRFQSDAIAHIEAGRSVLVSAPTGTGKTIIADFVVDEAIKSGRQVVYTAPIKALSNQKYRDYTRLYGKEAIGLVTGDLVINRDAQIRIMTTEILRNILLQEGVPPMLAHVIVDEAHFLDDVERGTVWEEVLIYLPSSVKILALSATLPNMQEFADWLSLVRHEDVAVVEETRRAVPLTLMVANKQTGLQSPERFIKAFKRWQEGESGDRAPDSNRSQSSSGRASSRPWERTTGRVGRGTMGGRAPFRPVTTHLDLVELLRPDYLPVLYFVFSRLQTEVFAKDATRSLRVSLLAPEERGLVAETLERFEEDNPNVLTAAHRKMYMSGIAFHHAGLHVSLKALVEELYERKLMPLLYCTSTFALGLNMPARTVAFDRIRKFNGTAVVPLTVRQFLQKAGRAGRRGKDEVGFVVIRSDFQEFKEDQPFLQFYRRGHYEPIESAFNLSFSSVVNLLHRYSPEEIRRVLDRSFLTFCRTRGLEGQRRRAEELEALLHEFESGKSPTLLGRAGEKPSSWRKEARQIRRMLEAEEGLMYQRFQEKQDYLKLSGYLNDDGTFNAGARALMHVQINEILVTELILGGAFEGLTEDELFGMLTTLVQEFPRSVTSRVPLRGRWAELRERLMRARHSEVVREGSALMGQPIVLTPELLPFGFWWAQGESLAALLIRLNSEIDVSGDLVGAFRRAKDLAGQLRTVFKEDPSMRERLTRIMEKVSRDEVEVVD